MNTRGTQKLHGLGHFMTEPIKYVATTIYSINKQHALTSYNGYPCYIRNKTIKRLENRKNTKNTGTLEPEIIAIIFRRKPNAGVHGEKTH